MARLDATLAGAEEQLPRLYLVEVEYLRNQLHAEAQWVRSILDDVEAGRLTWPEPGWPDGAEPPGQAGSSDPDPQ